MVARVEQWSQGWHNESTCKVDRVEAGGHRGSKIGTVATRVYILDSATPASPGWGFGIWPITPTLKNKTD